MGMISLLFIISLCAVLSFQIFACTWQVDQGSSESVYLKPKPSITRRGYGWRLSILSRGTRKSKGTFSKCFYLFLFVVWLYRTWHSQVTTMKKGAGNSLVPLDSGNKPAGARGALKFRTWKQGPSPVSSPFETGGLKAGWVTWLQVANASRKPTVILVRKPKEQSSR